MSLYSLHIGLNRVKPEAYGGWEGDLNACENDATGLCSALTARGFSARYLLTENCTLAAFGAEISTLAAKANADAAAGGKPVVIISDSSHGGQQMAGFGYDETICLFDGQLIDVDFRKLLAQFAAGVLVVVILDCCHSGGMDRSVPDGSLSLSAFRPAVRSAPASTRLTRSVIKPRETPAPIAASIALFCACQAGETASDGEKFGAWTGSIIDALHAAGNVQTWFTIAAAHCPQGQHPVLRPIGDVGVLKAELPMPLA